MRSNKFLSPLVLAGIITFLTSCGGGAGWFYPYDYDYDYDYFAWEREWPDYRWHDYPPFGGYTIIRSPVTSVDAWTARALSTRPYYGYSVRRHNSPVIEYTATRSDRLLKISLTPMADSTRVEIRARRGKDSWDRKQAKMVMGTILKENR